MFCNRCGTAYPDGSNYCQACGHRMGGKVPAHEVSVCPDEGRQGFLRRTAERIVRMGFVSRIGEGIDRSACRMNLRVIRDLRATELLRRGLTEEQAGEQAAGEIAQFATMWGLDLSSLADVLWVKENFPLYAKVLDSTPSRADGEDSAG